MKKQLLIACLIGMASVSFCSCSTDNDTQISIDLTSNEAKSNTMSDAIVDKVESIVQDIASLHTLNSDSVITYTMATKTMSSAVRDTLYFPKLKRYPNAILIDFGSGNITSPYPMSGKIIVYTKDTLSSVAACKKMIYNNFFLDSKKMEGNKLITYYGTTSIVNPASLDSLRYIISSHDTITAIDGQSVWNSYLTKQKIKLGGDTIKYSITGYAGGIDSKNHRFTMGISAANPLIRYSVYPYIVSGKLTITSINLTSTLDYGNGTFDELGIFTSPDGVSKTVSFK